MNPTSTPAALLAAAVTLTAGLMRRSRTWNRLLFRARAGATAAVLTVRRQAGRGSR